MKYYTLTIGTDASCKKQVSSWKTCASTILQDVYSGIMDASQMKAKKQIKSLRKALPKSARKATQKVSKPKAPAKKAKQGKQLL
jgi:hypothetical protein